jgi:hypothetical protein
VSAPPSAFNSITCFPFPFPSDMSSAGQRAAAKQGASRIRCAAEGCVHTRKDYIKKFHGLGRPIPESVPSSKLKTGVVRSEEVLCETHWNQFKPCAQPPVPILPAPQPPVPPAQSLPIPGPVRAAFVLATLRIAPLPPLSPPCFVRHCSAAVSCESRVI